MKIRFMGTAASEGIPGMFCACDTCVRALKAGGRNIMTRSQVLIDDGLAVDFGPDTYWHFLQAGRTLAGVRHVLVTHSHGDHIGFEDLSMRADGFAYRKAAEKLTFYCGETVENLIRAQGPASDRINSANLEKYYAFVRAEEYKPISIEGYTVTPFPARHAAPPEKALLYLIEKDGKAYFHGNDTGVFENDGIAEYLGARGKKIDLLALDCTKGDMEHDYYTHMSFSECRRVADSFIRYGACGADTRL
ncbi:MAG: MBL fold metallo-hydrolase, partial [Clostridiales bacterium]|nr:MBL fold metallo-hydrolase [Clostridiales bacterium]